MSAEYGDDTAVSALARVVARYGPDCVLLCLAGEVTAGDLLDLVLSARTWWESEVELLDANLPGEVVLRDRLTGGGLLWLGA